MRCETRGALALVFQSLQTTLHGGAVCKSTVYSSCCDAIFSYCDPPAIKDLRKAEILFEIMGHAIIRSDQETVFHVHTTCIWLNE